MYDIKFEESGLLAEFFGFEKVQLESSTKYICKCFVTGLMAEPYFRSQIRWYILNQEDRISIRVSYICLSCLVLELFTHDRWTMQIITIAGYHIVAGLLITKLNQK